MDEKQGKRDIVGAIRRLVELAMPNLWYYYRMTKEVRVAVVYESSEEYFCDVQPLRNDESTDPREPVVPCVALPVLWGDPDQDVIYPPVMGALCDLNCYDGDPNYPFASNVRQGGDMSAPKAALSEFVIQLEDGMETCVDQERWVVTLTSQEMRAETEKNWTVRAGQGATVEMQTMIIKGARSVTLEAPNICQNGNVTTSGHGNGSGNSIRNGGLVINGNLKVNGNTTVTGTSHTGSRSGGNCSHRCRSHLSCGNPV